LTPELAGAALARGPAVVLMPMSGVWPSMSAAAFTESSSAPFGECSSSVAGESATTGEALLLAAVAVAAVAVAFFLVAASVACAARS